MPDAASDPPSATPGNQPESPRVTRPVTIAAIALGGSLGTLTRAALEVAFPTTAGQFPWTTLGINLLGSFVLGLVLMGLLAIARPSPLLRNASTVAIGFLGGFTTFSTFMVEAAQLARTGHVPTALLSVVVSILGGLAAAWLGFRFGRRFDPLWTSHEVTR